MEHSSGDRPPSASLWRDEARPPTYGPLIGRHRVDVAIVGAGVTGLTLAYLLKQAGATVVVLERGTVGSGTTGRTTAKVTVLHGAVYQRLLDLHGREAASAYAEANGAGLDRLLGMTSELGVAHLVERRAAMSYVAGALGMPTVEREAEAARRVGLDVDLVSAPSIGVPAFAGVRLADQAQLDPQAWLDALAAAVDGQGCAVHERSAVIDGPSWDGRTVTTPDGRVEADQIVLTTGVPPTYRGLYFARAEPVRSYLVAVRPVAVPTDDMVISVDEPTRSLRTARAQEDGDVLMLVGGEGHVTGRCDRPAEAAERLVRWADSCFGVRDVVRRWSAQDYESTDALPYVGALWPLDRRCHIATGFGKWGMTNGTAAAMALAGSLVGTGPPTWAEPFDPARAGGARSVGRLAALNGSVARQFAMDWSQAVGRLAQRQEVPSVADGEGRVISTTRGPLAVSCVDGQERCLSAVCPHLGGIVKWNDLERSWDCPLHGSRFAADGSLLEGPTTRGLAVVDQPDRDDDVSD